MTHRVSISLIILAMDFTTGIKYILSAVKEGCSIPWESLPESDDSNDPKDDRDKIPDIVEQLCKLHFDLDMSWVNPTLFAVKSYIDDVSIYFAAIIPFDTPLKDSFFLPIQLTRDPTIVKAGRDLL